MTLRGRATFAYGSETKVKWDPRDKRVFSRIIYIVHRVYIVYIHIPVYFTVSRYSQSRVYDEYCILTGLCAHLRKKTKRERERERLHTCENCCFARRVHNVLLCCDIGCILNVTLKMSLFNGDDPGKKRSDFYWWRKQPVEAQGKSSARCSSISVSGGLHNLYGRKMRKLSGLLRESKEERKGNLIRARWIRLGKY